MPHSAVWRRCSGTQRMPPPEDVHGPVPATRPNVPFHGNKALGNVMLRTANVTKLRILSWEDAVDGLAAGDAITKGSVRGRRWGRGRRKGGGVRVTADVTEEMRKLDTTLLPTCEGERRGSSAKGYALPVGVGDGRETDLSLRTSNGNRGIDFSPIGPFSDF